MRTTAPNLLYLATPSPPGKGTRRAVWVPQPGLTHPYPPRSGILRQEVLCCG
ncbi:MAG: hypothetical protein ACFCVD_20480 [Nodosilinea sp.]